MRIQHNIMAMNAYRNYNTNTSALSKNLEKLSSGYKINRAGDDAAGLAISEKMRAQITGLNAAQKNVKDGISLVKTAEGAMQEIQDMLNRMDYLATQSANGTYDDEVDRLNLNKEMDALKEEIDRIAQSANFNGIKLLDGSLTSDFKPGQTGGATVETIKGSDFVKYGASLACGFGGLHEEGKEVQEPSFEIDLKQALDAVKASAAATLTTQATFAVKIQVGGASVSVKFKVTATIGKGELIDFNKINVSSVSAASATSVKIGAGSKAVKFGVTVSNGVVKFAFATGSGAVKNFNSNMSVTISMASGVAYSGSKGNPYTYNCTTQKPINGVEKTNQRLAHGHFEVTSDMAKKLIEKAGSSLEIGGVKITFDPAKRGAATSGNVVNVKDLMKEDAEGKLTLFDDKAENIAELARRIAVAANGNSVFTVGVDPDGKTVTLEEKRDNQDWILKDEDWDKQVKYSYGSKAADTAATGKDGRLILQIGDTSDKFNQLEVEIGSMMVEGMGKGQKIGDETITKGLDEVKIDSRQGAAEAVNVIKAAINYVSGVRGDLGAIQNRLEHTANNLSVMAENIQDAESTIRDTDVAEEMMAYTKNNILVQSAQAMLAQANAVPQGVLQLLG